MMRLRHLFFQSFFFHRSCSAHAVIRAGLGLGIVVALGCATTPSGQQDQAALSERDLARQRAAARAAQQATPTDEDAHVTTLTADAADLAKRLLERIPSAERPASTDRDPRASAKDPSQQGSGPDAMQGEDRTGHDAARGQVSGPGMVDPWSHQPQVQSPPDRRGSASQRGDRSRTSMQVQWLDTAPPVRVASDDEPAHRVQPATTDSSSPPAATRTDPEQSARDQAQRQRKALETLHAAIQQSDDPALQRAIRATALSLLEPSIEIDPKLLAELSPDQQKLVKRYRQLLLIVAAQIAEGDGVVDRVAVADLINQTLDTLPIQIRTAQLCSEVSGYGVYEPLNVQSLIAGQPNPMLVYVELDNFKIRQSSNVFEVDLTQEIELFTVPAGVSVWRQSASRLRDESRNRRRDFFLVQRITLPQNLSVGSYMLKVRVRDNLAQTLDEVSIPITVVTQPSQTVGRAESRRLRDEE